MAFALALRWKFERLNKRKLVLFFNIFFLRAYNIFVYIEEILTDADVLKFYAFVIIFYAFRKKLAAWKNFGGKTVGFFFLEKKRKSICYIRSFHLDAVKRNWSKPSWIEYGLKIRMQKSRNSTVKYLSFFV